MQSIGTKALDAEAYSSAPGKRGNCPRLPNAEEDDRQHGLLIAKETARRTGCHGAPELEEESLHYHTADLDKTKTTVNTAVIYARRRYTIADTWRHSTPL